MATRIQKILNSARRTLADPNAQRWTDSDLLQILIEGQEDFNQQTEFLQGRVDIVPEEGNPIFDLPTDCWKLSRVLYDGSALPFITHRELDEMSSRKKFKDFGNIYADADWENETGEPIAIIYDRISFETGKIYPIPENLPTQEALEDAFGVVTTINADDDQFGVVTATTDSSGNINYTDDDFGVVSSFEEFTTFLRCYYIKNPQEIEDVNGTLDIPAMYDIALKFYVTGQAFLDDIDTGYQEKGAQQLVIYQKHVDNAKKTAMQENIQAGAFQTTYRRSI